MYNVNMSKLIIIEAPGKIETVKKAVRPIWGFDCDVIATGGYLSTLSNTDIGVDFNSFLPVNMVPTESAIYFNQKLQKWRQQYGKKGPWTSIVIMSDPDREGEGIAGQIFEVVKKWFPDAVVERRYVNELTSEAIKHAVSNQEPDKGIILSQQARMVLDRLLPFAASCSLNKAGNFIGLGRLQLETTRVIKQQLSTWKRFLIKGPWKTNNGVFHVEHRTDSLDRAETIISALRNTTNSEDIIAHRKEMIEEPPKPHSAFSLMSALHDMRPEDVMSYAQKAYMQARISYPRTDQRVFGKHSVNTVGGLIDTYHLNNCLSENWYLENIKHASVQGAHPALHPLSGWHPPGDKNQARIENEIAARAMASLMRPAKYTRLQVTIDAGEAGWVNAYKYDVEDKGWTEAYSRLGLSNPLFPDNTFGKKFPQISENFPTLSNIIGWMEQSALGRPSTVASIPSKLQILGLLSSFCTPTALGEKNLQDVYKVLPVLTKPEFTHLMEKGLDHISKTPDDYTEVVKSLLVEAGVDIVGLPDMVQNAQNFDAPEQSDTMDIFF